MPKTKLDAIKEKHRLDEKQYSIWHQEEQIKLKKELDRKLKENIEFMKFAYKRKLSHLILLHKEKEKNLLTQNKAMEKRFYRKVQKKIQKK